MVLFYHLHQCPPSWKPLRPSIRLDTFHRLGGKGGTHSIPWRFLTTGTNRTDGLRQLCSASLVDATSIHPHLSFCAGWHVSRVLAYTQGAHELRLTLPYPFPQSHGVDTSIAVQGRVSGGFIVTKLKNPGSTVHLPPEEYIVIDDHHWDWIFLIMLYIPLQ